MKKLKLTPYAELTGIHYIDEQRIVLKKNDLKTIAYQDGKSVYTISNCNFKKLVIENEEEIDFPDISLSFIDCIIEDLQVNSLVSNNISLWMGSSIVAGKISDCPLRSASFNNCIVRGGLFLTQLDKVHINYTEENIDPRRWRHVLQIYKINDIGEILGIKQSIYIYNCIDTNISSNWKEDNKGGFYLKPFERNNACRLGYKLTQAEKEKLNLAVAIKYDINRQYKETKLTGINLSSLSISGTQAGKLSVENVTIVNWYMHDFYPNDEVNFYGITASSHNNESSKLEINKCNLDKAWFDNIDFNTFSLISFYRTKFSKTVFTSCSFPKGSIDFQTFTTLPNIHYAEKKEKSFYKDKYEVFLQLKMALEATGNVHEAQKLFSISNEALRRLDDVPMADKIILRINRCSNNHGLSISRPFWWLLGVSILFYILYLLSIGRIFNSNEFDSSLIGYYFSFLDITHRNDFLVDKSNFTGWSLFIDYFNKVLVSFFIYQFIAAFRKYGKK
jgi:uncharacterized protein YjbI with pentapeptide repeats